MKAEGKEKKQRQSQSCDACRVRKVKCEPMTPVLESGMKGTPKMENTVQGPTEEEAGEGSGSKAQTGRAPCKQCFQLGVECLYIYRPRKRGPPNLYLRRLSEAQKSGQSFPTETDFEAAKASSRAVAERKKARGKGKEGHALEHILEADRKDGDGGDVAWNTVADRSLEGMSDTLDASSSNGTARSARHLMLQQNYVPRLVPPENSHLMGESFIRTPLPDATGITDTDHQKYSIGTGRPTSEDPFTPSQFMNLDAEMNFSITPGNGKPSPSDAKYPPRHASRVDSYPISEQMGDISTRHLANPHAGHSHPSTISYPAHHRSKASSIPENTLDPILSPGNLDHAGAYFTSPSDTGSVVGIGTSQYPAGVSLTSMLPDRRGSSPSRSISIDLSALPNNHVEREFLMRPSAAHSTTAVHGDPSTGGTDIQVSLPIHTLTSKTLGEVGAPYLYNQAKDGNVSGRQGDSPPTILLGDSKKASSFQQQAFGGPQLLHQPSFHEINANPLEAIIPRPLLHHIINLFFDYVYPLTPCLHKPTFIQDLARQREMDPNQGEWIALVLATVMSTLVQVPRAFVPLTRREVKDLAYRCHIAGRNWSLQGYKDFTVNAVIIRYFDAVYNYCRGEIATCHTSLCEAQALSTVLRLHEEETYTYLNPIEREVRRRIFFLLFQADKSESVLSGRPIRLREEECYSLRLPEELDDDYITETRYLQQPEGMTSVITGFNASIRIHCLGGRAITKHKEDKRDPPTGVRLERRLEEVSRMLDEVTNVMRDCPPQLRLKEGLDSRVQSPAGGWDVEASAKLQAFFFDPQASREFARNAFLVQQGNCFVTKACVTFVLLQYQNDLLHLKAASTLNHSLRPSNGFKQIGGMPLGGISTSKTSAKGSEDYVAASKESLYYDLLSILHSIPIQCIAVNGPSLVNCVRYVASGLLDTVQLKTEDNMDEGGGVARAQGYLIDFLSILSDIEKNYSLDDDE